MEQYRLMMRGITKTYGSAAALQDVEFKVRPGEVHALIGENGAGKSTLLNILSGVRAADSGVIHVNGEPIQMRFMWAKDAGEGPRWEQAFSRDDGATWEVNWVMDFRRID